MVQDSYGLGDLELDFLHLLLLLLLILMQKRGRERGEIIQGKSDAWNSSGFLGGADRTAQERTGGVVWCGAVRREQTKRK